MLLIYICQGALRSLLKAYGIHKYTAALTILSLRALSNEQIILSKPKSVNGQLSIPHLPGGSHFTPSLQLLTQALPKQLAKDIFILFIIIRFCCLDGLHLKHHLLKAWVLRQKMCRLVLISMLLSLTLLTSRRQTRGNGGEQKSERKIDR